MHLVAALAIDAAIAAVLAAGGGFVGGTELDVKRETLEFLAAGDTADEVAFGGLAGAIAPGVDVFAIEEDDGLSGRGGSFGWATAFDAFELADVDGSGFGEREHAFGDGAGEPSIGGFEREHAVFDFAGPADEGGAVAVPAGAGQAPGEADGIEFPLAEGDDLHAPWLGFEFTGVFPLEGVIGVYFFGIGGVFRIGGGGTGCGEQAAGDGQLMEERARGARKSMRTGHSKESGAR